MENFSDAKGVAIVADTVAILGLAVYFYRQNESMKKEIEDIKKSIALVSSKSSKIEKDIVNTKETSKKVTKKVESLQNNNTDIREDIVAISKKVSIDLPSSKNKKRSQKRAKKYGTDSDNSENSDDDLDSLINNTRT